MEANERANRPAGRPRKIEGVCLPADILRWARGMRAEPMDAETKLWRCLRNRRLGGFKFRRQHPAGRYILDFYCLEARVAVELDGGQHADPGQEAYDQRRERALVANGIRVLRFWDNDALRDTVVVLQAIWDALHEASGEGAEAPSPTPSPQGRGGGQE